MKSCKSEADCAAEKRPANRPLGRKSGGFSREKERDDGFSKRVITTEKGHNVCLSLGSLSRKRGNWAEQQDGALNWTSVWREKRGRQNGQFEGIAVHQHQQGGNS